MGRHHGCFTQLDHYEKILSYNRSHYAPTRYHSHDSHSKISEMRGFGGDITPTGKDSLDRYIKVPPQLADRARKESETILKKLRHRPGPEIAEPPSFFDIAPRNIPRSAISELLLLQGYEFWAQENSYNNDNTESRGFFSTLARELSKDLEDDEEELASSALLPAHHSDRSESIATTQPQHFSTTQLNDSPVGTEEAEVTSTASIPLSSHGSSHHPSLPSTETSDSGLGSEAQMEEKHLYYRVLQLHNEARQQSLRLYQLQLLQKNLDWKLDEEEQKLLNTYKAQLALALPNSDGTVTIDLKTAFDVAELLSHKRDTFGPLLEEIHELGRHLYAIDSRQRLLEEKLHNHYAIVHQQSASSAARSENESHLDDESEASELKIFDPSRYHPLYNEWQSREAQLKNLQEKLWAFEEEELRLADQKEIRSRFDKHLLKEDEEELDALPAKIAELRARFERDREEAQLLEDQCLKLRIIDENGEPRESTDLDTEAAERMGEWVNSEASEDEECESDKYDELQDQVARMKNKQEKLRKFQEQKSTLQESGKDSESESFGVIKNKEQLEMLTEQVERLAMELEEGLKLQNRLRGECLHEGLIDEQGERTANHSVREKSPDNQQQRVKLVVSPPPASDTKSFTAYELQSASTFLRPPAAGNKHISRITDYPLFAASGSRIAPVLLSHSDPLSIDAWLFDQLIDSGGERRLLATILQAKGASDYEDLQKAGQKVVYYWNIDPYTENTGLPPPPYKDLRESVILIKREGYDNLLVKQVLGYAMDENCRPEWEKNFELSDEDEDDLPDY